MYLANVSIGKSQVVGTFDAIAIRFGALISDETVSAGDLHYGIKANSVLEKRNVSFKVKLDFIADYVEGKGAESAMDPSQIEIARSAFKFLNTIKYKNALQIKHLKEWEKWVNTNHDAIRANFADIYTKSGFTQLTIFDSKVLRFLAVDTESPETLFPEEEKQFMKMSEVLLDRFHSETTNDAFLVTGDFSDYIKSNHIPVNEIGERSNLYAKMIRASKSLVLPHIVLLSANELQIVREHLISTNSQFRINYNEMIKDFISLPFIADNFDLISERYKKEIEPFNKLLQAEIEKNDRLRLIRSGIFKDFNVNINIYFTSISTYWEYLLSINIITEETMDVIKAYPDYDTLKNNTCIIIECASAGVSGMSDPSYRVNPEPKPEEEFVLTKRKVLDL